MDGIRFLETLSRLKRERIAVRMSASSKYLRPREVIERWNNAVTVGTLANWRSRGHGPAFTKFESSVMYPIDKLEKWEDGQLKSANDNERKAGAA